MTDAHPTEETVPALSGRVCEVGRDEGGRSEVYIDLGRGEQIKVSGLSDAVAKSFARNLYKHVSVEFTIHEE